MTFHTTMEAPLSTLEAIRPFLVAIVMFRLSLSLLASSDGGTPMVGLGVEAFHFQEPTPNAIRPRNISPFRVTAGRSTRSRQRQREKNGWHSYTTTNDKSFSVTRTSDEELTNDTYFDVNIPETAFVEEGLSADALSETPSMALTHEGNRMEMIPTNKDQQPIVLFDGLSPDTWKAVQIPEASTSVSTTKPETFSSLVMQTRVPSVAIQSLSLGNFLVSPQVSSSQKQHKHQFLAAARLNRYWMGPKFGGDGGDAKSTSSSLDRSEIPVDTQYLLVEVESQSKGSSSAPESYYALMMPLVDGGYRSSLESSSSSIGETRDERPGSHKMTLVSYSESGENLSSHDPSAMRNALYVAIHDNPYELLRLAFREVSEILGGSFRTLEEKQIPSQFANSFGWCSWDAFYSKVHPSGILDGVKYLSEAGIPVKNIILDDGWQQVSPPYLHQQEETESKNKKTSTLAASLSLSGSSDIMPPVSASDSPSSMETASTMVNEEPASKNQSVISSFLSSCKSFIQNPLEALSNLGGSIFGVIASGVTKCYQKYVENAPTGSLPNRLWTFLARNSPLNYGLWQFFESETDFGRQLNDFPPNWKFLDDNEESSSSEKKKNMALKELVGTLKNDWKVNKVYCWHSIHGYWRGVSDELGKSIGIDVTQVLTRPSDHILRIEREMAYDPPSLFGVGLIGKKGDLSKFYRNLHEPLASAGVDGVKVDVQSGITAAGMTGNGIVNCPPLAKLYTQTMEDSVSERFPSNSDSGAVECINCMCHSTENLYRYKTTAIARASDDFYPARPESHSVHLVNVAYNSLFLGEICLPDWDMFHSEHASAELHAAARAIGGCPVYVSDVPGKHNVQLLQKLVLPDGSVLRAQKAGRPTRDCIFADVGRDGTSALKIWNVNHESLSSSASPASSGGVLGVFNVQGVAWNFESNENQIVEASPSPVTAVVRPHDVDSLRSVDGPFAIWSHRSKLLQILGTGGSAIDTTLDPRDWEIFTIQPVQRTKDSIVQWAPIGLVNMLNSGGGILNVGSLTISTDSSPNGKNKSKRIQADISTRGPGDFVSYCQPRPLSVLIRSGLAPKQLDFTHDPKTGMLEFELPPETIEGKAHLVSVIWEQ